jgi:hypothetical protein
MTILSRRRIEVGSPRRAAHLLLGSPERLTWALVAVGILLRIGAYAHGRGYWLDERFMLRNIEGMAPFDLLRPMRDAQLAPPGFVALERLLAARLGSSPYALRLVPLAGGIAAMVVFRSLAMRALTGPAVPIAVGLFALSDDLIYYSAELKPYILDASVAVVALWFGLGAIAGRRSARERPTAVVFGLIAPWLAFASGALLPAVALAWGVSAAGRRDGRDLAWAIGSGALWAASGLGSLFVARSMLLESALIMDRFWGFAFMPIPPSSRDEWAELVRHALNVFAGPGRVATPFGPAASAALGLGLAALGAGLMAHDRRWETLALLLLPGLLHALASSGRLYPFHGRLTLYLAASLLPLIGRGLGAIWRRLPSHPTRVALVAVVFLTPTFEAVWHLAGSYQREFDPHGDLRPAPF